jgi:hypothetical protein
LALDRWGACGEVRKNKWKEHTTIYGYSKMAPEYVQAFINQKVFTYSSNRVTYLSAPVFHMIRDNLLPVEIVVVTG